MRLGAIERKILAGFLLALVISLIVGFVLYRNATRIISTERWVRHKDEVIEQVDKLVESLIDLDAEQRGYFLTTNETFLNRVGAAERGIPEELEKLQQLIADNPVQQQRIATLRSALKTRLAAANQGIDQRPTVGFDAALAMLPDQLTTGDLNKIGNLQSQIEEQERKLREKHIA